MKKQNVSKEESQEEWAEELKKIIASDPLPPVPSGNLINPGPMYPSVVPEILKESNAIFHYTSVQTAIEHILYKKELKLSPRKNATDPLEKFVHALNTAEIIPIENQKERLKIYDRSTKNKRKFEKQLKTVKQLSFCRNNNEIESIDDLGFMNMRMWDQYADGYQGVCLAFDKKSFVSSADHQSDILKTKNKKSYYTSGNVDYLKFLELDVSSEEIKLNSGLLQSSPDEYEEGMSSLFELKCFTKHRSYGEENEFRICALNDSEDGQMLKFQEKDLLGIIYFSTESRFKISTVSNFNQACLHLYAKRFGIGLYRINIKRNHQNFMFETVVSPALS